MIGNDIVDLKAAAHESNWRRRGFLEKVFNLAERKIITASENRDLIVWVLWSLKEAAYKAHQRKYNLARHLNWKILSSSLLEWKVNEASGIVEIDKEFYSTHTSFTSDVIHTVAFDPENGAYKKRLFEKPVDFSKRHLSVEIGQLTGLGGTSVAMHKTSAGIPFFSHGNQSIPISFSISGHGKFSGFCISLRNS